MLLVEIDSPETKCIIPGKLFEYMQSGRPIIGFGPENADFKTILSSTNSGNSYNYKESEKEAIKSNILSYFEAYQTNSLRANNIGVQQFHRKQLTEQLAAILKPLLKP